MSFHCKNGKAKQKVSATCPLGKELPLASSFILPIILFNPKYTISFLYSSFKYNLGDTAGTIELIKSIYLNISSNIY